MMIGTAQNYHQECFFKKYVAMGGSVVHWINEKYKEF